MDIRFTKIVICVLLVLFSATAAAGECRITILHFNDLHGYIDNPKKGLGGAARIAALIGKIGAKNAKEGRHTLVIIGGDLISGTPVSEKYKGEAEFKFAEAIGTTVMVIGNHDFDFGVGALRKNMKSVEFPVLSANIIDKKNDRLFTNATYVFPLGPGCRVGVMGLTIPKTPQMTGGNVSGLEFKNPVEYAGYYIDDLVEQSEVQVALTHLGVDGDIELVNRVPGFDVVVGGHDHVSPGEYCRMVKGIPVCQTPSNGRYLGRIDVKVENGRVVTEGTEIIQVGSGAGKAKDVKKLLEPYLNSVRASMVKVVGSLDRTLYYRADGKMQADATLGSFVADAMRVASKADIAFVNSGGMRKTLKKGRVTKGDIFEALPFPNFVGHLNLTGAEILAVIDRSEKIGLQRAQKGGHLTWSGLEYKRKNGTYDVEINGRPMDKNVRYKAATWDFLANGGDGYTMLKVKKFNSTGRQCRDIVTEHLRYSPSSSLVNVIRETERSFYAYGICTTG